jgi:hypothetical protein
MGKATGSTARRRRSAAAAAKPTVAPAPSREAPTPEQLKQGVYEKTDVSYRCTVQVPIDYYLARGDINLLQHAAGNKLYTLSVASGLFGKSIVPVLGESFGRSTDNLSDQKMLRQLSAKTELRHALTLDPNPAHFALLYNVCCYGYRLNEVDLPIDTRHRMSRFREALDLVAYYFRLPIPDSLKHVYTTQWRESYDRANQSV